MSPIVLIIIMAAVIASWCELALKYKLWNRKQDRILAKTKAEKDAQIPPALPN